jgi:hypothetical protein
MECDYCCAENQAAAINNVLKTTYILPKDQCTSNSMNTFVFYKSTGPDRDNKLITPEQKNCCTQEEFDLQKSKVMNRMEEVLKTVPSDPGGFDQKIKGMLSDAKINEILLEINGMDDSISKIRNGLSRLQFPINGVSREQVESALNMGIEARANAYSLYINLKKQKQIEINKLNQQKQVYTIPLDPVGYTGKGTSEDPWKATKLTDGYPRFMNDEERKKYYCRENNCEIPGDYFYKIVMNKVDVYM